MAEIVVENGVVDGAPAADCDADSSLASEAVHSAQESHRAVDHGALSQQSKVSAVPADCEEVNLDDSSPSCETSSQPVVSATDSTVSADLSSGLPPARLVTLTSPFPSLMQSLRMSALKTVKRTRQSLAERLGHGSKTVDIELDSRIDTLRDIQHRYTAILQLVNSFTTHFTALVSCHQALDAEFSDLAQKTPELHNEFAYNAETQRTLHKNGETLLAAVTFFSSSLNTLCFKTIEDTLLTVKQYEDARMEYDAYRIDAESKQCRPETQQRFQQHKLKFNQLRQVLDIKLQLLDENRVKVMHQQLILFQNAMAAYFSGNQTALDGTVQQFSVPRRPSDDSHH